MTEAIRNRFSFQSVKLKKKVDFMFPSPLWNFTSHLGRRKFHGGEENFQA